MHITVLRKVGGSVMLAVPPAILELLELQAGATVGIALDGRRLVIDPSPRKRYSLGELLAQCDAAAEPGDEDRNWTDGGPIGGELL